MSRLQYWSSPLKGYTCCRGKAILLLFQFWLIHLSNGVHLTNTISYTAIDLAKSAGMDDDDISAAIPVTEEEGLLLQATDDGTIKDSQQKYSQDFLNKNEIPSILEVSKSSSVPVLPLCCSTEGDDTARYQCNSESLEHLQGSENVVKRKWTAPAKLVSTKEATSFKLVKSVLSCHYAAFAASISLTADASDAHHFYPDGNLKYENEFYRIDEYCISSIRKEKVYLQICQANCTDPTSPCIQKCCGLDEVYSFGYDDYPAGCQPISRDFDYSDGSANGESFDNRSLTKWSPILYHDLSSRLSDSEVSNLRPHYILNYPSNFKQKCKSKKTTVFPFGSKVSDYLTMVTGKPFKNLQFKMRKDGWLLYPFRDSKGNEIPVVNRILNYCIDGAQHYGEMTEYANQESQSVLFLCSGGVDEGKKIKRKRRRKKPKDRRISIVSNSTTPKTSHSTTLIMHSKQDNNIETSLTNTTTARITITSTPAPTLLASSLTLLASSKPTDITDSKRVKDLSSTTKQVPSSKTTDPVVKSYANNVTISPTIATTVRTRPTRTRGRSLSHNPNIYIRNTNNNNISSNVNKTVLQERKVTATAVLFRSSRNKQYYNKVMSYNQNNSSTTTTTTSTKKPRYRKRSKHYIFYKPITVHNSLLHDDPVTEQGNKSELIPTDLL